MTDRLRMRPPLPPDRLRELAKKYRLAMLRLGATDADFAACGVEPPTDDERAQSRAEGYA